MTSLQDSVVVITGGGSGIGRAAALDFAKRGAHVIITGRRPGPLADVASEHGSIVGLVADAASASDAHRVIAAALDKWGRLDTLVNNAGAGAILPLQEASAEKIQDIFAINVVGPSLYAAAALPHLAESKGSIINISSTYGLKPGAGLSHYAASKAALDHLTRCWALELADQGIRVNAVAAGPTESGALTGMMGLSPEQAAAVKAQEQAAIPLRRRGEPADISRWIVALAEPASAWTTGQVIAVDGGLGLT